MKSSFLPVIDSRAKVLVLGSLPGDASLAAQEYYAFKQNAFWRIMEELFAIDISLAYELRLTELQKNRIALWDVIAKGERKGSLDTAIDNASLVANNFEDLLSQYPGIRFICLNGRSVETLFNRHVKKKQVIPSDVTIHVMPSTSPANARMRFEEKLERWKLLKVLLE